MKTDLTDENIEAAIEILTSFTEGLAELGEDPAKAVESKLMVEIVRSYLIEFLAHKVAGMAEREALIASINGTLKLG